MQYVVLSNRLNFGANQLVMNKISIIGEEKEFLERNIGENKSKID